MEQINIDILQRGVSSDAYLSSIRKSGYIPGVLYGNKLNNRPIQLDYKEFIKQLKKHGKSGIFQVNVDNELLSVKINEIQRDPVSNEIIHVDLHTVDLNKAINIAIPIQLFGGSIGVKNGGILQQQLRAIEVKGLPSHVPETIHLNISDLDIGQAIYVRNLMIPDEIEVLTDLDTMILTIVPPKLLDEDITPDNIPKSEPKVVGAKDGQGIDAAK